MENRNRLVNLLLEAKSNDDNLERIIDEFFVSPQTLEFVEPPSWSGTFTWDSLTTDLGGLGYSFGDTIRDDDCLRRMISFDKKNGRVWVTSRLDPNTIEYAFEKLFLSDTKKYDAEADVRRLASACHGDDTERTITLLESEIRDTPRFRAAQQGLSVRGVDGAVIALLWDEMTTNLAKRGLAFGDVVENQRTNRLHRVVAHGADLWVTSETDPNKIIPCADEFKKHQ